MEFTVWEALLEPGSGAVPRVADVVADDYLRTWDRVRIGVPEGASVTMTRNGDFVVADVFLPDGASALTADQEQALTDLGWYYGSGSTVIDPIWTLDWRSYADAEVRAVRGGSVVAVLRDVLALPAEGVTVRGWGNDGPFEVGWGLERFDDRPSALGAPELCTEWDDLRPRLDWVLGTLPTDAAVVMQGPDESVVQFMTSVDGTMATSAVDPELDPENVPTRDAPGSERARRMFAAGWWPTHVAGLDPGEWEWTLGRPNVHAGAGSLARKAVAALRTLGAERPTDVRVRSFRNGSRPDPLYVPGELGLAKE
ncbi:TY-Chap domain-containing protein [Embleya scabrispora]|nr:hypothetical protein [Embleya scabrispora]